LPGITERFNGGYNEASDVDHAFQAWSEQGER
jgi:hypothetical protein